MSYEYGFRVVWSAFSIVRAGSNCDYRSFLYLIWLYKNGKISATEHSSPAYFQFLRAVGQVPPGESGESFFPELFNVFEEDITHIFYQDGLVKSFLETLSTVQAEWYDEYYCQLFEDLLERIEESDAKRDSGYYQPDEVTLLASILCDYSGQGCVFNPYAGSASYCVGFKAAKHYYGIEIDQKAWVVGVLRLLAHKYDYENFVLGSSYKYFDENKLFDFIVSTPPHLSTQKVTDSRDPFRSFEYVEEELLYYGMQHLTENGKLACVLTPSFFYSQMPSTRSLRKELVENDLVSKVILLPDHIFSRTASSMVLLLLEKRKQTPFQIQFVDGSSFVKSIKHKNVLQPDLLLCAINDIQSSCAKYVPSRDVERFGFSLDPKRYLRASYEIPEGYKPVFIRDILSPCEGERVSPSDVECHILKVSSLSNDPFNWKIQPESLAVEQISGSGRIVHSPVIVFSKVSSLRVSLVEASTDTPVFIPNNIAAFRFNENSVFIPIFIYELRQKGERILKGSLVRNIRDYEILQSSLFLPPTYEAQKALFDTLEQQDKIAKAKELGLEKLLASQKKDFINSFRSRKHDLGNLLGAVVNNVTAVSDFICNHEPIMDSNDGRAHLLCDECVNPNVTRTISQQIERLKSLLSRMDEMIVHLTDDTVFGEPEVVDLCNRLHSIQSDGNYKVEFSMDLGSMPQQDGFSLNPKAFVYINANDFDRVLMNILNNAKKHGFKNPDNNGYIFGIELSYDFSDDSYVVVFKNNGAPMPKNMDTERYGINGEKGEDSDGQGAGGSIVKNIIEHFNGQYEVINEPTSLFPVKILIKLPRYDAE